MRIGIFGLLALLLAYLDLSGTREISWVWVVVCVLLEIKDRDDPKDGQS